MPLKIILIPSYGCNLSCSYCYEGNLTQNFDQWHIEDIEKIAEICISLIELDQISMNNVQFTFMGGEPIRKKTLPIILALMKKFGQLGVKDFHAISNGYELCEFAFNLKVSGMSSIQVTVDGPKEIHDSRRISAINKQSSFDSAIKGIKACLSEGIKIIVRVNIDHRNVSTLWMLADIFNKEDFFNNQNFSSYLYPISNDFAGHTLFVDEVKLAELLVDEAKNKPQLFAFRWNLHGLDFLYAIRNNKSPIPKFIFCAANCRQYVIDSYFDLYTCWFGIGDHRLRVGCLNSQSKKLDIDNYAIQVWRNRSIAKMFHCRNCRWALICGGGCSIKAFARTSRLDSPNCANIGRIIEICAPYILKFCS